MSQQQTEQAEPFVQLIEPLDQKLLCAFGQGQATARKGGYLADNPHQWEGLQWQAWRAGFNCEKEQRA